MRKTQATIIGSLLFVALVFINVNTRSAEMPPTTEFETRCGWLSNPTPANFDLYDSDRDWIIGVQGGYQVERDWYMPDFKPGQWVRTNNNYGYGCACLKLRVNKETSEVAEIESARAKPLASCRNDPSLKKWNKLFK